jgi:catalase
MASTHDRDAVQVGDQKVTRGVGGEYHQTAEGDTPVLTTNQGVPVTDDQNSLKIGPRGPTVLEDFHFREKIFHFDHERIPERVVHARGMGAHGYFETYESLSDVTRADLFQRRGEKTEVFVRFSTVAGNKGSADVARDVRGFAVKFYTKEGNWDLVGNNIPVFFIQDAIKFPCESAQRLAEQYKLRHPEVDWRGISGLRNVLVHSYFEVDLETIWAITQRDLPVLESAVKSLLRVLPPDA